MWMWPLLLVVAAGAVLWTRKTYGQTHPKARPALLRVLVILRTTAFLALLLAIAGPVISLVQSRKVPPEILVLLEDSGSMSISDAGPSGISRWDYALDVVRTISDVFDQSGSSAQLTLVRGNGIQPSHEFELDDAVITTAQGHGTDLDKFVSVQTQGKGRTIAATVLISDGQQTVTSNNTVSNSGNSGGLNNPLFVLGVGDSHGSADRLITDLRYPDLAYAGDDVVIQLAVAHRFTDGSVMQDMVIRLSDSSGELVQKVISNVTTVQSLELQFVPSKEGMHVYELEVSPLDNERFQANNKVSLAIDVQKSRARVLLLSQFPGWDVRYLAQAALNEPRVDLEVVYAAEGGLVLADSLTVWQKPQSSVEWLQWDGVILTSWTGKLDHLDWSALASAVEQGLGLVIMPGAGIQIPQIRPLPALPVELQALLPVKPDIGSWQEGSYFLSTEGDLLGHPVLSGVVTGSDAITGQEASFLLDDLPPLTGVIQVQPRNEALPLLSAVQRSSTSKSTRNPVLVVSRRGAGPVAWFAGRRLWETAFWNQDKVAAEKGNFVEQPMMRLFRNLLVWISAGAQENGLAFTGHRSIFQAGEQISLAAQWRDLRGQPLSDRSMYLLLNQKDSDSGSGERRFSFGAMDSQTGSAEVVLPVLPPGSYSIQLLGAGDPPVAGPQSELTVLDHSVEDTQVRMDRRHLAQFAYGLGGKFYDMGLEGAIDQLVSDLQKVPLEETVSVKRRRFDFWSGWFFLLLIVLLLGTEWFLRRRNGML